MARDVIVYDGQGTWAAGLPGVQVELDKAAKRIETNARTISRAHADTGDFGRSFSIEHAPGQRGVTDRLVSNSDEASGIIDWRHRVLYRAVEASRT